MMIGAQAIRGYLVLSPQGRLATDGAAVEFEDRVQDLVADGFIHLVADLEAVPQVDSRGIRALVRAYNITLRFGGCFRLVHPSTSVRKVLVNTRLTDILPIYESVEAATEPVLRPLIK